ncbi:MAG: hypothetical protein GXP29_07620, partial [Planctomycetes bacterium]|nr:hypothetical protein [Planctomycetota bacterium]
MNVLIRTCAISALIVLACSVGAIANAVDVDPYPIQAGEPVTVQYDPAGRVFDGAPAVLLHYGFNAWNPTIAPDVPMTWNATLSVWEATITAQLSATQMDMVFTDGLGVWDNNEGADWHSYVLGQAAELWSIDGALDADAVLVADNGGRQLYAGVRGTTLYVAAPGAANGNDHFIFVSDSPGGLAPAPWDKGGVVAQWSAYIGNEVDNGFSGWFDVTGATEVNTGVWLEGTIDLQAEFGGLPSQLFFAAAAYPTGDGASLNASLQIPASLNGNGNLEAAEYAGVSVSSLLVGCFPLDLDADCDFDSDDFAVFAG